MKKITVILAFALIMGVLAPLAAFAAAPETVVVTDEAGNRVEVPKKVERVVVAGILPFPSVITVYLNSAAKLVGIPPASMGAAKAGLLGEMFPEILKAATNFQNGNSINVEEIMKLRPDVVFYNIGNADWGRMLKNAGIPAVAISPSKWNYNVLKTYDEWIGTLSQVFPENSGKSKQISAYSKRVFDSIQAKAAKIKPSDRKKVLFLFQYDDKRMVTSGKSFFGQYWCDAVGAKNAAEEITADNADAAITMEHVYKWNPDVIIITNFTPAVPEDLYKNRIAGHDWSNVKAVKNHEVYKMPLGSYRTYTPGADTPITLQWMAQKVYPDVFKSINIEKATKNYYQKLYGIKLTSDQVKRMFNQGKSGAAGVKLQ